MTTLATTVTNFHVRLYRALDGRFVSRGPGSVPLLLLTTTGRRSGLARTVPVGYVRDGADLLVSPGTTSGSSPGWLRNLEAQPQAHVQLGSLRLRIRAEEPSSAQQVVLWGAMVAARPIYRLAERNAGGGERRVPVVIRLRVQPSHASPTSQGGRHVVLASARRRLRTREARARSRTLG